MILNTITVNLVLEHLLWGWGGGAKLNKMKTQNLLLYGIVSQELISEYEHLGIQQRLREGSVRWG